jgi:hypothetical protein
MYYAKNITADASHTFTVTNTGGNDTSFWVMEISGADITAPHDQSSGQGLGSTTAISSGTTATRTNANDILVSAFCTQQTNIVSVTAGAGYTLPSPDPSIFNAATANPGSIEYQIVSSVGTDDGTFTVGAAPGASGCIVAAFKAAGTVGDLSAFPGEPQTGSSKIQGGLR